MTTSIDMNTPWYLIDDDMDTLATAVASANVHTAVQTHSQAMHSLSFKITDTMATLMLEKVGAPQTMIRFLERRGTEVSFSPRGTPVRDVAIRGPATAVAGATRLLLLLVSSLDMEPLEIILPATGAKLPAGLTPSPTGATALVDDPKNLDPSSLLPLATR